MRGKQMSRKRMLSLVIVVTFAVCGVVRVLRAQSAPQPHAGPSAKPQSGEKKAEEQFKNIQVLKGVPADQIFPTMQFISASLGVECEFCHTPPDFEKDDKKAKQTARKMMEMMIAINADNFDRRREVTCYSCHRGNAQPVAIPPVMTAEARNGMVEPKKAEPVVSTLPTADQLLDKYVQAAGGATAIDNITTRVMKGQIEVGDKSMPIEIYTKYPEKRISFTHMPEGDSITAFNGREGWLGVPGRPVREMQGNDLDGAAIDADLHLATHLKQMFSEAKVQGTEKIGDRETYEIVGQRDGKTPIRLYFDEQSGLLVRLVRFGETALGWLPTQIDYTDYRDTDGVKIPYGWTLARTGGRFTIRVSEVKQNVAVDDEKFVKPAPAPGHPANGPGK